MTEKIEAEIAEKEQGSEIDPEQQQAGSDGETLESVQAELTETRKALAKANREAATRRKKLDELEAAEKEREEARVRDTGGASGSGDPAPSGSGQPAGPAPTTAIFFGDELG